MTKMAHVNSFRDLEVYKLARELSKEIFKISKTFPKEETWSLTDQVRRSSRSVGGQIAEAWAKRRYEKHFISKLTDADGEQQETQHWLESAYDCKYIEISTLENLIKRYESVGRMIHGMINKSESFCKKTQSNIFSIIDYNQKSPITDHRLLITVHN